MLSLKSDYNCLIISEQNKSQKSIDKFRNELRKLQRTITRKKTHFQYFNKAVLESLKTKVGKTNGKEENNFGTSKGIESNISLLCIN